MGFHEIVPGYNDKRSLENPKSIKRQKNLENMFKKERERMNSGKKENPKFFSKIGTISAKFARKNRKEEALEKAKK